MLLKKFQSTLKFHFFFLSSTDPLEILGGSITPHRLSQTICSSHALPCYFLDKYWNWKMIIPQENYAVRVLKIMAWHSNLKIMLYIHYVTYTFCFLIFTQFTHNLVDNISHRISWNMAHICYTFDSHHNLYVWVTWIRREEFWCLINHRLIILQVNFNCPLRLWESILPKSLLIKNIHIIIQEDLMICDPKRWMCL